MHITSWVEGEKDLSEPPKNLRGNVLRRWIYQNLKNRRKSRFSEFEASDNYRVARMLTRMIHVYKDILPDGGIYPWSNFKLKGNNKCL